MTRMMSRAVSLGFALLSLSCARGGGKGEAKRPEAPQDGFNLTYKDRFAEIIDDIQKDKDGNVWVGHSAKNDPESPVTSYIEKRDAQGNLSGMPIELGEVTLAGMAVLDDGGVVAAVYADGYAIGAEYALRLIHRGADGGIVAEKKFEDYAFQEPPGFKCQLGVAEKGFWGANSVRLAKLGESFVLLSYNCRYSRLSLLDRSLNLVWSKEISVEREDFGSFYGSERLFVTPEGTIITASRINASEVPAYNAHFHDELSSLGESDVLLNAYDAHGTRLYSGIVGTPANDLASAVVAAGDKIYVAADIQVDRPTSVRGFQRDAWLAAYDVTQRKAVWSKAIDIQDEDAVEALAIMEDKYLAMGGSTGWLQVPTMSVVKHGDAFVVLTDLEGHVKGKKIFGTARHDYVSAIVGLGGGRFLVGGVKDGPITHDGDDDKRQWHRFGFTEVFSLDDVLAP